MYKPAFLIFAVLAALSQPSHAHSVRQWTVYFVNNTPILDDDGTAAVAAATEYYNLACPGKPVTLISGTDTVGSHEQNAQRSQAYGEAVMKELIKDGVAASVIRVQANGESHLQVPTDDDVAEILNRRVEIYLGDDPGGINCGDSYGPPISPGVN